MYAMYNNFNWLRQNALYLTIHDEEQSGNVVDNCHLEFGGTILFQFRGISIIFV